MMTIKLWANRLLLAVVASSTLSTSASAAVSVNDMINYGMPAGMADYAASVSRSEGNWGSVNPHGCVGAFQFCPGTLERYYSGSRSSFIANPAAQVNAWVNYQQDEWGKATRNGMTAMIGQEICYNGRCATITASSILKACQFGCGTGGKLHNLYQSGNCDARNVKDGNLVSVCEYLIRGSGYNVEDITNMAEADLTGGEWNPTGDDGVGVGIESVPTVLMPWETHKPSPTTAIHGTIVR